MRATGLAEYLTISEAAEESGLKYHTAYRNIVMKKRIPSIKKGRKLWLVRRSDISKLNVKQVKVKKRGKPPKVWPKRPLSLRWYQWKSRGLLDDSWMSLDQFLADAEKAGYRGGSGLLRRIDTSKKYSNGNVRWGQ